MGMGVRLNALDLYALGRDPELVVDVSKRTFLRAAGLLVAGMMLPRAQADERAPATGGSGQKIIVVIIGGVRRAETFSRDGLENIPHLAGDLFPKSLFYPHARNEGVTAHFNAISSILTGNWQRVDDWGKLAPTTPTLFEQFREGQKIDRSDTWVVASNKALTSLIGASSASDFGPAYGANVVFPKQLMLTAVADALRGGRTANLADRSKVKRNSKAPWKEATTRVWARMSSMHPNGLIRTRAPGSKPPSPTSCTAAGPHQGTSLPSS